MLPTVGVRGVQCIVTFDLFDVQVLLKSVELSLALAAFHCLVRGKTSVKLTNTNKRARQVQRG